MRRLLNTLYVTTQGAYLSREREEVVVQAEGATLLRVPIHTLEGIACFGQVSCSPWLIELCGKRGVDISFLSLYGRFWGRVVGPASGNVLLRREQYRQADDLCKSAEIARAIVAAKVANSRCVLQRAVRDYPDKPGTSDIEDAVHRLGLVLKELQKPIALDTVRGKEGEAARHYYACFDHLITVDGDDFRFTERSRRPPMDNINALLSFVYTLLMRDVASAVQVVGLDPQVGFLHRDRPGRPGLALDLMEELRAFVADRLTLSLVNRQQINGTGFRRSESGAVLMEEDTRKAVIIAYQKRKQDEIEHPFLDEKVPIGLLPFVQALLLARYLRGDIDGYPPFFWR